MGSVIAAALSSKRLLSLDDYELMST